MPPLLCAGVMHPLAKHFYRSDAEVFSFHQMYVDSGVLRNLVIIARQVGFQGVV